MKFNTKKLKEEIGWTFTDFTHNKHMQIQLKDGKFVQNKYTKNKKDTRCYCCDLIRKIKKQVLQDVEDAIKESNVCTVKPCKDSKFEGMDCLESENQYGFFKSQNDRRPSSCVWIDKEKAKRLYNLFSSGNYEFT